MRNKQPSDTRINREGITVKYTIEYTEKDEPINNDYTNLKQFQVKDIEEMLQQMFLLRQCDKHNINIGYNIEDSEGWLVEDYCNDTENFSANSVELKQKKSITILEQTIKDQQKELDNYNSFIKKYNATKQFEEYQKEQNTHTYYYRLRPPSIGCQPSKGLISTDSGPTEYNNRTYHGTCTYDRELTEKELNEYELDK